MDIKKYFHANTEIDAVQQIRPNSLIQGTVLVFLSFSILFLAPRLADFSIYMAVALAWVWLMLPGLVLSLALVPNLPIVERIPVAFVLSIGLAAPVTVLSILLRVSLSLFTWLILAELIAAWFIVFLSQDSRPDREAFPSTKAAQGSQPEVSFLLFLVIAITAVLAYLSATWLPSGDDISGMSIFSEVIQASRITGVEPFHGTGTPSTPRNELIVWTYLSILVNKISGVSPFLFFMASRPVLIVIALLSLFVFLRHWFKDQYQTIFLFSLWLIFLLLTLRADGTGHNLVTRIVQDKFLGWFVIVPVTLVFLLWFLESRERRHLIVLGFSILGATFVHPITFTQLAILGGGFVLFYFLLNRKQFSFLDISYLALIFAFCLLTLGAQYLRYQGRMPIEEAGLGAAVEFGRLRMAVSRFRLWLLEGNQFILHPSLVLNPAIISGYLALPVIIFFSRRNKAYLLVASALILLPLLLFVPFLASLVGLLVTPYLLWRVAWPLELFAILSIGSVFWLVLTRIERVIPAKSAINTKKAPYQLATGIVLLALLLSMNTIKSGFNDFQERLSQISFSTCYRSKGVLAYLDHRIGSNPANVLASKQLNMCIPALAGAANVVEYRGFGTVNRLPKSQAAESLQRVEDIDYFTGAELVDDVLVQIVDRYDIEFILLERDRFVLNLQFSLLPEMFSLVYEDADFSLYTVDRTVSDHYLVSANTAIRLEDWTRAQAILEDELESAPDSVLAYVAMGKVQTGLGQLNEALDFYRRASRLSPDQPALHVLLAETYLLVRQPERAVQAYQRAANLAPGRYSLLYPLGRAYIIAGESEKAIECFSKAAEGRTTSGSTMYHTVLGGIFKSVNWIEAAIEQYQLAIDKTPDSKNYVTLGEALARSGRTDDAITAYQKAIRIDPWLYTPHVQLGEVYRSQGKLEAAISEFKTAWRLNPTFNSSLILMAQTIQQQSGLAQALDTLEQYRAFNSFLTAPRMALASLYIASGENETALREYEIVSSLMPKNASVQAAIGSLLQDANRQEDALKTYEKALSLNRNSTSVHLGLSLIKAQQSEIGLLTGHYLEIVRLNPLEGWPRLLLADVYQRQGDWAGAEEEIQWAIKLQPNEAAGYAALGNFYARRAEWGKAISSLETALKLDPENAEFSLRLGEVYQEIAEYTLAQRYFEKAIESGTANGMGEKKLAELFWQTGQFDRAVEIQEKALSANPQSTIALIGLADFYVKQGKAEEAKELYRQVLNADSNNLAAFTALVQLVEEGDTFQDIDFDLYRNSVQANAAPSEAYLNAGRLFLEQGDFEQARQAFQTGISISDFNPDLHMALSGLQQKQGDFQAAETTLQNAAKVFPGNARIYHQIGALNYHQGDLERAQTYFRKAKEADPGFVEAYIELSRIASNQGDPQLAEQRLLSAVRRSPGSAEAYLALSNFYEAYGDVASAETYLKKAIEVSPSDADALIALGEFYTRQRRYEEGREALVQAAELPGIEAAPYLAAGKFYSSMQAHDAAIQWFQQALKVDQSDPRAYIALAQVFQKQERWEEAVQILEQALAAQPSSVEANMALGELWQRQGNNTKATYHFEAASSFDRSRSSPWLALGEIAMRSGDWEEAASTFVSAVEASPTDSSAYIALSNAYRMQGQEAEAEKWLKACVDACPDLQTAFVNRAEFYARTGQWEQAFQDYESAWQIQSPSPKAGLQFASFLRKRGQPEAAIEILKELARRSPNSHQVYVELGNTHAANAQRQEAINAYEKAIRLEPGAVEAYFGLAKTYEVSGGSEASLELLLRATRESPDNPEGFIKLAEAYQKRLMTGEALTAYKKAFDLGAIDPKVLSNLYYLRRASLGARPGEIAQLQHRADSAPTPEALIGLASLYQVEGEWASAGYWYRKAVDLNAFRSDSYLTLGNYYRSLDRWEEAAAAFEKGLEIEPYSPSLLIALGSVKEESGEVDGALDAYRSAIEADPSQIEGYIALAELQQAVNQPELAVATAGEAVQKIPGDPKGFVLLGNLSVAGGDPQKALEAVMVGLDRLPGSSDLYATLGNIDAYPVLEAHALLEEERALYNWREYRMIMLENMSQGELNRIQRRALQLKLTDARSELKYSSDQLDAARRIVRNKEPQMEAAKANYLQALAHEPADEAALIGLGRLHLAAGAVEVASYYFERSAAAHPTSVVSLSYWGLVNLDRDRPEEARQIFERVLLLDPNNALANYGTLQSMQKMNRFELANAIDVTTYGQHNWTYLMNYFRELN